MPKLKPYAAELSASVGAPPTRRAVAADFGGDVLGVGESFQKAGAVLNELRSQMERKRLREEALWANQVEAETLETWSQTLRYRMENAKPEDRITEHFSEDYKAYADELTAREGITDETRIRLRTGLTNLHTRFLHEGMKFDAEQAGAQARDSLTQAAEQRANAIRANPDLYETGLASLDATGEALEGTISARVLLPIMQQQRQNLAAAHFEGRLHQAVSNRSLLDGIERDLQDKKWTSALDARAHQALWNRVGVLRESQGAQDRYDATNAAADAIRGVSRTGNHDPEGFNRIIAPLPEAKQRHLRGDYDQAAIIGGMVKNVPGMSPQEIGNTMAGLDRRLSTATDPEAEDLLKQRVALEQAIHHRAAAVKADPVGYIHSNIQHFPAVREYQEALNASPKAPAVRKLYMRELDAAQGTLGIDSGNRRYLSASELSALKGEFRNLYDRTKPETAVRLMAELQTRRAFYGAEYWPQIARELGEKDVIPSHFARMAELNIGEDAWRRVAGVAALDPKNLEQQLSTAKVTPTDINQALGDDRGRLAAALMGQDGSGITVGEYTKILSTLATSFVLGSSDVSVSEAVAKARAMFFENSEIAGSNVRALLVPKLIDSGGAPTRLTGAEALTGAQSLISGLNPSDLYLPSTPGAAQAMGLTPQSERAHVRSVLQASEKVNLVLKTSADGRGVALFHESRTFGGLAPVSGQDGKQITFSWVEVLNASAVPVVPDFFNVSP